jgi:hypothetical protein
MTTRSYIRLCSALLLLASLLTGTLVASAQPPPPLTETFTWQPYNLSVQYPRGWIVSQGDSSVSFSPADRDVGDGFGPELVIFDQPNTPEDNFEAAIATFAEGTGAAHQITARTTRDGVRMVRAILVWPSPAASGELMLLAAKPTTALGAAYIVRDSDVSAYGSTLAAIFESVTLGGTSRSVTTTSAGVASVQIPQAFAWDTAGLVLYFPDEWTVSVNTGVDGETVTALPDDLRVFRSLQATTIESFGSTMGLRALTDIVVADYGDVLDSADVTIAGHAGVLYDVRDTTGSDPAIIRILALDIADQEIIALLVFAVDEPDWDDFRPLVSAMISEIAPLDG